MVTARSDKNTVVTSIQAGCDDYIIKPFDRETVRKKLTKLWGGCAWQTGHAASDAWDRCPYQ